MLKTSAVALAFLLLPSLALAAGLGKLTVHSGLGQPLKAEIELVSLQKGEADSLSVRLPSAETFRQANIEYGGALLAVKFSIEQRGEDRHVVVLSSTQPIVEPFLDLLVELNWPTGRLVREYTFLLDPPEYKGPPQASSEVVAPTAVAAPVIKSAEAPKEPEPRARVPSVDKSPAPAPKGAATYEVKRGDTLAKIASANKSEGVSLQQMLIALYRSNMGTFDGNNINRMRAGRILTIPDKDMAASVGQSDAARTVAAHAADFNEYRRKLGAAVATAPERADARRQSASGKVTAKAEDKPAAVKDAKDQLKLSKTEDPGKTGAKRSPQGVQEDLLAKEKQLKDASERIAMLEKSVRDMQKLLELKSQSGALLEQQAAKASAAKVAEPAKAPEMAKAGVAAKAPEAAKATGTAKTLEPAKAAAAAGAAEPAKAAGAAKAPEPAKAVDAAKAPEPAKAVDAARAPEPAKAAEPAKSADVAKTAPKAATKAEAPASPPSELSFFDQILENELAMYGGGGFLVLLFGGYGYYAWKRKKLLQKMDGGAIGAPGLASDSVFGAAGGAKVDSGQADIQGDLGPGGATAVIDAEEVDPIAEADVYMAYGRDAQAEEILKEALVKNPSRQPIRTKLLEIYAGRKDARTFAIVAAELHAGTGGKGAEWEKALALGLQLDPENPLYGGSAEAGETRTSTGTQVLAGVDVDVEATVIAVPDIPLDTAGEQTASTGLDFDLDLGGPAAGGGQPEVAASSGVAPATDVTTDLDFDFDLGGEEKTAEAVPAALQADVLGEGTLILDPSNAPGAPDALASIDFDFELPGSGDAEQPAQRQVSGGAPSAAAGAPASSTEGEGGIDFDFNLDLDPPASEEQAPAAPLDLSSINLDLGAPGGAAAPTDAHWQEVATKLDLAKAYQEMGDKDGARELLTEVLTEGDVAQQQQARTMLSALG